MTTPALGGKWEARQLLAILTILSLVAAVIMLFSGTALADHVSPDDTYDSIPADGSNETPFWVTYLDNERGIEGATCTKISQASATAFVMPAEPVGQDWVLLVVKQATTNYIYYDPIAGHEYPSEGDNAPGYSHVIVCSVDEPDGTTTTSTTLVETTSTTLVETTVTTEGTTSSSSSMPTSSSSSVADSTSTSQGDTSTSQGDTSTSATVENTTVTSGDSTSSTAGETSTSATVEGTVVTTSPTVDADDLPFTGLDSEVLIGLAVVLLGLGAALLTMTRRVSE